jgi:hypothetical protein
VNGEVCEKVCKKKRKKILTESALLEMDGLRDTRPLSGGSGCAPIQLTLKSELTLGLPRMELAKCFEQFAFFTSAPGAWGHTL